MIINSNIYRLTFTIVLNSQNMCRMLSWIDIRFKKEVNLFSYHHNRIRLLLNKSSFKLRHCITNSEVSWRWMMRKLFTFKYCTWLLIADVALFSWNVWNNFQFLSYYYCQHTANLVSFKCTSNQLLQFQLHWNSLSHLIFNKYLLKLHCNCDKI